MASGHPAAALDPGEEVFDDMTVFTELRIVRPRVFCSLFGRDHRDGPHFANGGGQRLGNIAFVEKDEHTEEVPAQQLVRAQHLMFWAGDKHEAQPLPAGVDPHIELGIPPK